MTGPQHYREAERLLNGTPEEIAEAQVHATLALAVATAEAGSLVWKVPTPSDWHRAIHGEGRS